MPNSKTYKIKLSINANLCIGCGVCSAIYEPGFEFDNKTNKYKPTNKFSQETIVNQATLDALKQAVAACPTQAIKLDIIQEYANEDNAKD